MKRGRTALLAGGLALLPAVALAFDNWYDYYLTAKERLIPRKQYAEALAALRKAVELKPTPAPDIRPYGMEFWDYTPYYYMGVCQLQLKQYDEARKMFDREENYGVITKRNDLYDKLRKLRKEAEDGWRQQVAQATTEEARRLFKEAAEAFAAKKHGVALTRLTTALPLLPNLDPGLQKQILDLRERVKADELETENAQARAASIEQNLAAGAKHYEGGRDTDAVAAVDKVLELDPRNPRALELKRQAQDRIRATTKHEGLAARLREGKALHEAGEHEKAIPPLIEAEADPALAKEAHAVLESSRAVMEGKKIQQEQRQKIDWWLAEGERLLAERKYPEAQVRLERILAIDPVHVRAKEARDFAQRMTGEAILARFMPNEPPSLYFYEPRSLVVQAPRVAIIGFATDDRAIEKVEFVVGGKIVAEQRPVGRVDARELLRSLSFEREFPLEPGPNTIEVRAVDVLGVERIEPLKVTRELRFYETQAFLPSAAGTALGLIGVGFVLQRVRRRRAIRRRFNPYIAGAPVMDDEMFFGRERLMARMLNVLHHNSLMITGERRIGKTTFLYRLKKVLETDQGTEYKFFPVFTDLQGVSESGFFHTLMADVVEHLALSPGTVASLRFRRDAAGYDGRDFSHDLQRVIEELKTRTDRRVKLALLIDEVDVLNEYSERVNQRLRGIFMKTFSEHLVAVMSGVGIKRTWKSEVSPWYNFFDEVELAGFTREEAEALIREPVAGVFRYQAEAVERILDLSEMKPYLVQKFCVHAVNRMIEDRRTRVSVADVESVREDVLIEGRSEPRPVPLQTAPV